MAKKIKGIEDLQHDIRNANKGTQRGRGMVEASLREVGAGRSIVTDKDGRVIAGNKTLEAAADIGLKIKVVETTGQELVVVQRNDLDLSDDTGPARKLAYYDNRAGETGLAWDAEVLLADLNNGVDLSGMFNADELDALLDGLVEKEPMQPAEAQIDKAAELQAKWNTQPGQLWQLGRHRLICGDCTDKETVERLMQGEKWDLIVTDPPYGVSYEGGHNSKKRKQIQGDSSTDLYFKFLDLWLNYRKDKGAVYLWFSDSEIVDVYKSVYAAGLSVRSLIIWNKMSAHYGNFMAQYMQKHEPCIYCVKDSTNWYGPTNEVTVWDIKQPSTSDEHPTSKPIECMSRPISNNTRSGDIVADCFGGSGTTLIACEQLGRQARLIELDAGYCAVILQRYKDSTNVEPVLIDTVTKQ